MILRSISPECAVLVQAGWTAVARKEHLRGSQRAATLSTAPFEAAEQAEQLRKLLGKL